MRIEPVRITELPPSMNVVNNSRLQLICRASGVPAPRISWSHNGRPINPDRRQYMIVNISGGSVLRITRVSAPRDNGTVECTASNGISEPVTAQTSIHVYPADNGLSCCKTLYNAQTDCRRSKIISYISWNFFPTIEDHLITSSFQAHFVEKLCVAVTTLWVIFDSQCMCIIW